MSWSAAGPPPRWTHPKPPKQQWLSSKSHPSGIASHPIFKGLIFKSIQPMEETNFSCSYQQCHSFRHYQQFMTIGEGRNVDRRDKQRALRFVSQQSSTEFASLSKKRHSAFQSLASSFPHLWTRTNKNQHLISNLGRAVHFFLTMLLDLEVLILIPGTINSTANRSSESCWSQLNEANRTLSYMESRYTV